MNIIIIHRSDRENQFSRIERKKNPEERHRRNACDSLRCGGNDVPEQLRKHGRQRAEIGGGSGTCGGEFCGCKTGGAKPLLYVVGGSVTAEYCSLAHARRVFGLSKDTIRQVCRGTKPSAEGHVFRFKHERHRSGGRTKAGEDAIDA